MPENTPNTSYHQQPDAAFWTPTTEPSLPEPPKPSYRGRFVKGHDPRRHRFTKEECSRGFWAAVESIVTRYPFAVGRNGRHMVTRFLASQIEAF